MKFLTGGKAWDWKIKSLGSRNTGWQRSERKADKITQIKKKRITHRRKMSDKKSNDEKKRRKN